jgi:predicted RNase H-like nuclease (RuvC/YqgF family)
MINLDMLKNAAIVYKEAGKFEEYKKILDLQEKVLEMQETINKLTQENSDLNEQLKTNKKLVFKNNAYWEGLDGPYCSACWDDKKRLVRMHTKKNNHYANCPACKNSPLVSDRDEMIDYNSQVQSYINNH